MSRLEKLNFKIADYHLSLTKSGSGFPLILLHTWHPLAKKIGQLFQNTFQIITFDTPGYYSKTEGKLVTNLAQLNLLLEKLFDRLNFQKVDLMGQCLGSVISLNFAAQKPNRVRNLICLTPPLLCYQKKINRALKSIFSLLERSKIARFLATHLVIRRRLLGEVSRFFGGYKGLTDIFAQESSLVSKTQYNPEVFFGLLSSAFHLDFYKTAKKVKARTLFVSGKNDPLIKACSPSALAKSMKNASFHLIPSAKHALPQKNSQALLSLLLDFYKLDFYKPTSLSTSPSKAYKFSHHAPKM